jgi:hypothetical protein
MMLILLHVVRMSSYRLVSKVEGFSDSCLSPGDDSSYTNSLPLVMRLTSVSPSIGARTAQCQMRSSLVESCLWSTTKRSLFRAYDRE